MLSQIEMRSQNAANQVGQNLVMSVAASQKAAEQPQEKPKLGLPEDKVELTSQAKSARVEGNLDTSEKKVVLPFGESQAKSENQSSTAGDDKELDEAEKKQLAELKNRDREVKSHEMAHMSAAGGLSSGGPSYETQVGPDGKSYAVGGHVNIDVSEGSTPSETISKARQIRAAATAPADPSPQDRAVASQAAAMEAKAQKELTNENQKLFDHGQDKKMATEGCSHCASNVYSAAKQYAAPQASRFSGVAI